MGGGHEKGHRRHDLSRLAVPALRDVFLHPGRLHGVERIAAERGMTAINTWEDRPITAGHGSIGLEILEQCPSVEQVLVPEHVS